MRFWESIRVLLTTIAISLSSATAHAAGRTFVANNGTDAGACAASAPCLTFAYALTQTAPAGEVVVTTPGEYGPVTITQSVSIVNDGVGTASITVTDGSNGVAINAGATDVVVLRGLEINGSLTGTNGIVFNSGSELDVQNCIIQHFNNMNPNEGWGININSQTAAGIFVYNSLISDNNLDFINNNPASFAILDNDVFINATYQGLALGGSMVIKRCLISQNGVGITVGGGNHFFSDTEITSNTNAGLDVFSGSAYVDRTVISGNAVGLQNDGGNIVSYENNIVTGNATDTSGTITQTPPY